MDRFIEFTRLFFEWCDDKTKVIVAVLIITWLAMRIIPEQVNLDIVYGGLFGLAAGMAIGMSIANKVKQVED